MGRLYEQLLLFPDRAERLRQSQYAAYRVDLEHWRPLSSAFLRAFRQVYERQEAAVLLVHGAQATGKTLFTLRLESDFGRTREAVLTGATSGVPAADNLWHTLVAGDPPDWGVIKTVTNQAVLRKVADRDGWLEDERRFAASDHHAVRVFVIDDVHRDHFLRAWAGVSQEGYLQLKAQGRASVVLSSVADQLVQDCRGVFERSIFLLLSKEEALLRQLKEHIDGSHEGLATFLELPLPEAKVKEAIVRTNTNRLNRFSYWSCLDAAGPKEKENVYQVLNAKTGFKDSFLAVDEALQSSTRRTGRPANQCLLTLVTLATAPIAAKAFLQNHEMQVDEEYEGEHLASWMVKECSAPTTGGSRSCLASVRTSSTVSIRSVR